MRSNLRALQCLEENVDELSKGDFTAKFAAAKLYGALQPTTFQDGFANDDCPTMATQVSGDIFASIFCHHYVTADSTAELTRSQQRVGLSCAKYVLAEGHLHKLRPRRAWPRFRANNSFFT